MTDRCAIALDVINHFVRARCNEHSQAGVLLIHIASLLSGFQKTSFRSVKEAMEAAQDGDQIILLPGIHNGLGYVTQFMMCSSNTCNLASATCSGTCVKYSYSRPLLSYTLIYMALPLILS